MSLPPYPPLPSIPPSNLPISGSKSLLLTHLLSTPTLILTSSTGSGKTTTVPFYVNELYKDARIAVTQPRRVAATSVARYTAGLFGRKVGEEIGYNVRFDRCCTPRTRVVYMTDGMILREATSGSTSTYGRLFGGYDVVIVDEAHERSVGTDVLLGLLKEAQRVRNRDFKKFEPRDEEERRMRKVVKKRGIGKLTVIVMSATIATTSFSAFFNDCPVLSVPGRSHAVQVLYTKEPVEDYVRATVEAVVKLHESTREGGKGGGEKKDDKGRDILAFLPGQEEIDDAVELIKLRLDKLEDDERGGGRGGLLKDGKMGEEERDTVQYVKGTGTSILSITTVHSNCLVLPLYASLPPTSQSLPFLPLPPTASRRIIISTNIAETSITLPNVGFVVDSGVSKVKTQQPGTGVSSLTVETITKANAMQRMGRCGRTCPGVCVRLYTEVAFKEMSDDMIPEILRVGLDDTVLRMVKMGVDCRRFEFVERPDKKSLYGAFVNLYNMGALDGELGITEHGESMSKLPTGVNWSNMIVRSLKRGVCGDVIKATAMAGAENVWVRPKEGDDKYVEATLAHRRFKVHEGDIPTMVNLYNKWERESVHLKGEGITKGKYRQIANGRGGKISHPEWCERNFINGRALARAKDVKLQLEEIVTRDTKKGGLGADKAILKESTMKSNNKGKDGKEYEAFLRCICEGLVDNAAVRIEKTEVVGGKRDARGEAKGRGKGGSLPPERGAKYITKKGKVEVSVHPSSFMFQRNPAPQAVVYNEMIVTKRNWIRGVTQVRREWIEEIVAEREGGKKKE